MHPALAPLTLLTFLTVGLLSFAPATPAQVETPTPTPDPTLAALETQVNGLSTQVAYFETEVSLNKEAVKVQAQKDFMPYFIAALVAGAVGAYFGITSPREAERRLKEKIEEQLDKAVFRVDPTLFPIYMPRSGHDPEITRLRRLGFEEIRPYSDLEDVKPGSIVVYPAKDLDDIDTLASVIQARGWKPDQFAFIIYTPGRIEGGEKIYKTFDNITFANNTITIATHLYALARGMSK